MKTIFCPYCGYLHIIDRGWIKCHKLPKNNKYRLKELQKLKKNGY